MMANVNALAQLKYNDREYFTEITIKASYLLLEQLDVVLTLLATGMGLYELNPLMQSLLNAPLQLCLVKLVIPCMVALMIPGKFLIPAIAFLLMVVGWNISELSVFLF